MIGDSATARDFLRDDRSCKKGRHDQEGLREPHEAPRSPEGGVAVALALGRAGLRGRVMAGDMRDIRDQVISRG